MQDCWGIFDNQNILIAVGDTEDVAWTCAYGVVVFVWVARGAPPLQMDLHTKMREDFHANRIEYQKVETN